MVNKYIIIIIIIKIKNCVTYLFSFPFLPQKNNINNTFFYFTFPFYAFLAFNKQNTDQQKNNFKKQKYNNTKNAFKKISNQQKNLLLFSRKSFTRIDKKTKTTESKLIEETVSNFPQKHSFLKKNFSKCFSENKTSFRLFPCTYCFFFKKCLRLQWVVDLPQINNNKLEAEET